MKRKLDACSKCGWTGFLVEFTAVVNSTVVDGKPEPDTYPDSWDHEPGRILCAMCGAEYVRREEDGG